MQCFCLAERVDLGRGRFFGDSAHVACFYPATLSERVSDWFDHDFAQKRIVPGGTLGVFDTILVPVPLQAGQGTRSMSLFVCIPEPLQHLHVSGCNVCTIFSPKLTNLLFELGLDARESMCDIGTG